MMEDVAATASKRRRDDIAAIVVRASFLPERQRVASFRPKIENVGDEEVRERLDRLSLAVAGGDEATFSRWMQWSDTDVAALTEALRDPQFVDPDAPPSWGSLLCAIVEAAASPCSVQEYRGDTSRGRVLPCVSAGGGSLMHPVEACLSRQKPIPFQEIFIPALRVARERLLVRINSPPGVPPRVPLLSLISTDAYAVLELSLLNRVSSLASQTFLAEFARFRPVGLTVLASIGAITESLRETPATLHYLRFVDRLLEDGLLSLFGRYPVLARFIAVAIDQWVDATAEFLQRLCDDLHQIEKVFQGANETAQTSNKANSTLGLITSIEPSLSDAHHGGRSSLALTFECGHKLVYKPKSLGLERSYIDLLRWCNRQGLSLQLMTHTVLDRHTHGWAEFVDFKPCQDKAAVSRFYRRAGMQLCLLYVLGASDCHAENLIAHGEQLVLVDMETLLFSKPSPISPEEEPDSFYSVLRTGLLPSWECRYDTQLTIDISGLGFVESQLLPRRQWLHVNTDEMHFAWVSRSADRLPNVPTVGTKAQSPADHVGELVDGFEEMYRLIMSHRDALLGADGPVAAMNGQPMRFIFRPTIVYLRILEQGFAPQCLQSGVEVSIQLANLCRAFTSARERPKAWSVLAAELRALEQLDVPYFGLNTDDTALSVGLAAPLHDYFQRSGHDEAASRIRQLDQRDLAHQSEIIRGSVYCGIADVHAMGADNTPGNHVEQRRLLRTSVPEQSSLEREAQAIAEEIQRRSIRTSPDAIDWVGLSYFRKTDRMHVGLLGDSLFDGRCGIALFLAAYARITGTPKWRDLALETLHPLRQRLHAAKEDSADEFGKGLGIGGATGFGSITYSLLTVGRLLGDESVVAEAVRAAGLLTDQAIESDRDFDVVNGAAGAALSLLAIHRETGDSKSMKLASACGAHLLRARAWDPGSTARRADGEVQPNPKIGFAHGNAGIWYSLLRLYAVTGEHSIWQAAEEIVAAERGRAQWPIVNASSYNDGVAGIPAGLVGTWCNGIPGIALARLAGLSILKNNDIEEQIDAAVRKTESWPLDGVDHMCCGNFGRIETLLVASAKLSRPRFRTVALNATAWILNRARQTKRYRLQGEWFSAPHFDPSFFHGAAGIGYGLLRVAHPEALPCVLLWE